MKTHRLLAVIVILAAISCSCGRSDHRPDTPADNAAALASRLLPRQSRHIEFVQCDSPDDFYSLETVDGRLIITGNNANSMAFGLGDYLRDYCHIDVTFYERDAVREPRKLPALERKVTRRALVQHRFFLNYCTFGYSLCWWGWKDWERLIDWMALNGVTLALANTGQEAVWQRVWMQLGLSEEQTRQYFTGPAFLPWHRMSNIDKWGGPLPQSWIDSQAQLQKKIVERELSLGINPILTSFNGHVPSALRELYPDADIRSLSDWGHYEERAGLEGIRCSYLNPADTLYNKIQKIFLDTQREMYGKDCHIYGIDPFNEVDPPSWDADYLRDAGRRTYETLAQNDPEAVWLQMGWLFYYDKRWTPELVEAYIGSVPRGRLLMIDYFCEKAEVYRRTESFFGQDFIWSYLGNFGGNTMVSGSFKDISFKLDRAYREAGPGLKGVGCTLEGLGVDPPVFEYVLDRAWERTCTDEEWIAKMADSHIGFEDPSNRAAWREMYEHCNMQISGNRGMTVSCRPRLTGTNNWRNHGVCYDNHHLLSAWGHLCEAGDSDEPAHRFDCVNIARQCLENYFSDLYQELISAYNSGDAEAARETGAGMLEVIADLDALCGTDAYFLMGKWIADARSHGVSEEEKDYLEKNARHLLSCWAFRGASLTDYANRCWNGLLSSYYSPRWESFIDTLCRSLDEGAEMDYDAWQQWSFDFEWKWATGDWSADFASKAQGDPVRMSRSLYDKYHSAIFEAPGTSGVADNGGPNREDGI